MTPEELIAEAKRRYPIGTKFVPAHVNRGLCVVESHDLELPREFPNNISFKSKYIGVDVWIPNVYYQGEWAEIINLEEIKLEFSLY